MEGKRSSNHFKGDGWDSHKDSHNGSDSGTGRDKFSDRGRDRHRGRGKECTLDHGAGDECQDGLTSTVHERKRARTSDSECHDWHERQGRHKERQHGCWMLLSVVGFC